MTQATVNGNTYSDDGTSARDMLNGGHRQWFLPMVGDVVTVAGQAQSNATQTGIDAANAANSAAATRGTSTTSTLIGAGAKTLTTQANKQFSVGSFVTISRTSAPATLMHGVVTAYNTGTGSITVSVGVVAGSGTFTDWTLALSGAAGATGATGNGSVAYLARTSAYTLLTTDRGSLIDCTSGTFTLAFQAAATLGANWDTTIRNSGTGLITLDPNAAELIDGVATYTLFPGNLIRVQCDGVQFRIYNEAVRLKRLPILSAAAAVATAESNLEDITPPIYATGLPGFASIIHGNSLYVAWAATNANVSSSPDGITWTLRAMPSSLAWKVGTNGTNRFLATVEASTSTASSTNGTTWAAATALPAAANAGHGAPAFNGANCIVFGSTAATAFTSTDNGATWSAAQTLPATANSSPVVIGGLYWYFANSTTAYTSATGATGSWTLRTLPFTGGGNTLYTQTDGSTAIGTYPGLWSTTDGINWTEQSTQTGRPLLINGVLVNWSAVFASCTTLHNGSATLRTSTLTLGAGVATNAGVTVVSASSGNIARISAADYAISPTGTFV